MECAAETPILRFDAFELDERAWELRRDGQRVEIQQKPLQLLCHLIRHRARVVTRAELRQEVWRGVYVSDGSLTTAVHEMRRALGDLEDSSRLIATVRGRGYRFMGQLAVIHSLQAPAIEALGCDLVGREAELARAAAALDRVERGERRMLLLHGAQGMGKTALALAIARLARERGFESYTARAFDGTSTPALWTWIQVVRGLMEARGQEGVRALYAMPRTQLMLRVPELSGRGDLAPQPGIGASAAQRFQLFDALASFIAVSTQARPALLFLDDLHAVDAASLAFLRFLAHDLRSERLFIVATHREPLPHATHDRLVLVRELAAEPFAERVELGCLGQAPIRRLLSASLGREPTRQLVRQVSQVSGGVPSFVAQVVTALACCDPRATDETLRGQVLAGMHDALRVRVATCSHVCQRLLLVLAAEARRWTLPLLRERLREDPSRLADALDEAQLAGLLRQGPSGALELANELVHAAIGTDLRVGSSPSLL